MPQSRPQRTSLFAAFTSGGAPIQNVFHFSRAKLEGALAERRSAGTASPGERIVQCTIAFYRTKLIENGLPIPTGLEAPPIPVEAFSISLSRDDIGHLLHAIDVSVEDIQGRAAAGDPCDLADALLEVNQALRARLAALLTPESLES